MMNNENDDNNKVELHLVKIPIGSQELEGNLHIPKTKSSQGIVIFAHGSGSSSRHNQRNQHVAARLNDDGLATLLLDLLTLEEEKIDNYFLHHILYTHTHNRKAASHLIVNAYMFKRLNK